MSYDVGELLEWFEVRANGVMVFTKWYDEGLVKVRVAPSIRPWVPFLS